MAELPIKSLNCLNRQDTDTRDDVVLRVNGTTISGPHDMSRSETVRRTVTGLVPVTLANWTTARPTTSMPTITGSTTSAPDRGGGDGGWMSR
ncbi:hypothetical protein [Amycolatopsis sp. NPDC051071]|uniref:hypothetical protein n=1 Tax=Amycolatopsis sp. NPDC051071 TaxID=3154637 RepID=UPI003448237A